MSLVIDDPEIERLVAEIAAATCVSEMEALRRTLRERIDSLPTQSVEKRVRQIIERMDRDLLPLIPQEQRNPLSPTEQDEILGYGPDGYPV